MFDDIRKEVEQSGGVKTYQMKRLRDAQGNAKISPNVKVGISKSLAAAGLAHWPGELPNYYWDPVRVYRLGTPVADLINAVTTVSEEADETLRETANEDNAAVLITRIRELVCE